MTRIVLVRRLVFAAGLIPAALLLRDALTGQLTANPIDYITDTTGRWALRILAISLAVTPLRRLTGWNEIIQLRRTIGLYAFFYASIHLLTFVWFDHWFDLSEILKDVVKRPFVTLGFAGFLLMLPLAVTSTNAMIRRLGRNWSRLHRAVYVVAVLGVVHYGMAMFMRSMNAEAA